MKTEKEKFRNYLEINGKNSSIEPKAILLHRSYSSMDSISLQTM